MAIQLQGDATSTVSSDLSVGGDLNVVGTSDLQGNVVAHGNSEFTGVTRHANGLNVTGPGGVVNSWGFDSGIGIQDDTSYETLTLKHNNIQIDLSNELSNQVGIYSVNTSDIAEGTIGLRVQPRFATAGSGSAVEVANTRLSTTIARNLTNYYGIYNEAPTIEAGNTISNRAIAYFVRNNFNSIPSANGNYGFWSNSVPSFLGGGVEFQNATAGSGTTVTGEILNHYEEGEWTPAFGTDAVQPQGTYNQNSIGHYIRVGTLVTVIGRLRLDCTNAGTGELRITGLPFTVLSASARGGMVVSSATAWGSSGTTNAPRSGVPINNTRYITLTSLGPGNGSSVTCSSSCLLVPSDGNGVLTNSNNIEFQCTYVADA